MPGTYGTAVPTLPLSRTIRLGQTKTIAGLDVAVDEDDRREDAGNVPDEHVPRRGGRRAGEGARSRSSTPTRSQAAFGSRLITKTIDLAANQIYQTNVTQLIAETNPNVDDLRNVQLEFKRRRGDGAVFAFTSSIDNGTADQILQGGVRRGAETRRRVAAARLTSPARERGVRVRPTKVIVSNPSEPRERRQRLTH